MVREENEIDIYRTFKNNKINKNKILIILLIVLIAILLVPITIYSINIIKANKVYSQYEMQVKVLNYQKEQEELKRKEKEEAERQAKIPKLTEEGRKNIENIYRSDTKRAFLTFDDGPSSVTNTILDILKQENVKATFFVLGSKVEAKPEIVKRIYDEGHYIANHGYSHEYSNIYANPQSVLDEFNKCNEAVKKAINVPEYNSHLFRFPGGLAGGKYAEIKSQANELLKQNDIMHIDWNSLTGDGETNNLSVEFELSRLQETSQNKNTLVVLMHDAPAKKVTAEALQQIISYLREQGYEFANFYEIIK